MDAINARTLMGTHCSSRRHLHRRRSAALWGWHKSAVDEGGRGVLETGVIAAGIDGSQAAFGAARWAALDAQRRGSTLRLVHAVDAPLVGGYPEPSLLAPQVTDEMRGRAARLLESTADQLAIAHPGLRIETVQQDGRPAEVLLDQSRRTIATVVGPDGIGRLSGVF